MHNKKLTLFVSALLALSSVVYFSTSASAAQLLSRSVEIGDSRVDVTTSHNYTFTVPTAGSVGSIRFEYCDNSPLPSEPCSAPPGLDVSGATIASQSGLTGFSKHPSTTANTLVLTRPSTANLANQVATYDFDNIVNPSDKNSIFVRISTFSSIDATGPATDEGSVVFATNENVQVEGYVPPYITFCTGITVAVDCGSANGSFIQMGELSKTSANTATSQYSGATNDPGGFSTSLMGNTMTSGNNFIKPMSTGNVSQPGKSQFGINLRDNSSPNVGQNKTGAGSSTAQPGFNTTNVFKFANQTISSSSGATDFNRFTVSYLVNIPASQSAGIYSATLTFVAVAAF